MKDISEVKNLMITLQPVLYVKIKGKKATGRFVPMQDAKRRGLPLPGLDLTCEEEQKSESRSSSFESIRVSDSESSQHESLAADKTRGTLGIKKKAPKKLKATSHNFPMINPDKINFTAASAAPTSPRQQAVDNSCQVKKNGMILTVVNLLTNE